MNGGDANTRVPFSTHCCVPLHSPLRHVNHPKAFVVSNAYQVHRSGSNTAGGRFESIDSLVLFLWPQYGNVPFVSTMRQPLRYRI
jgi:hypothetical protein